MGLSGLILRKYKNMNLEETKDRLAYILDLCNCNYVMELHNNTINNVIFNSYFFSVTPKNSKSSFIIYVYGKNIPEYDKDNFDFIDDNLTIVINIEDIYGYEEILIQVLYEYFKIYHDDYFYNELEWHYDKSDIDKIYKSNNWLNWCYKRP